MKSRRGSAHTARSQLETFQTKAVVLKSCEKIFSSCRRFIFSIRETEEFLFDMCSQAETLCNSYFSETDNFCCFFEWWCLCFSSRVPSDVFQSRNVSVSLFPLPSVEIYLFFSLTTAVLLFLSSPTSASRKHETSISCGMALRDSFFLHAERRSPSETCHRLPEPQIHSVTVSVWSRRGEEANPTEDGSRYLGEHWRDGGSLVSLRGSGASTPYLARWQASARLSRTFHFRVYELTGMQERAHGRRAGTGKWNCNHFEVFFF